MAPLSQQGAVGGDHHLEALLPSPDQYLLYLVVEQRFPHQMEIEILCMGPQFFSQELKALWG